MSIDESDYTLPPKILKASHSAVEVAMGTYNPVLVSINNETKYLVSAFSGFFECGDYKGKDIDPNIVLKPSREEYIKDHYIWGDTLWYRITVVFADLPHQVEPEEAKSSMFKSLTEKCKQFFKL